MIAIIFLVISIKLTIINHKRIVSVTSVSSTCLGVVE
jgi:hypothetical protein